MRVNVVRAIDDHVLNVRDTDEIIEELAIGEAEAQRMEHELRVNRRWWLSMDIILYPRADTD